MLSLSIIIFSSSLINTYYLHFLPFFQVFQVFLFPSHHLSVLDSSGTSRSATAEIRPRPANTPVSALGSFASHAGSSSGSESRSMINGKALHKTVPQPAAAGTKVEHKRKDHG